MVSALKRLFQSDTAAQEPRKRARLQTRTNRVFKPGRNTANDRPSEPTLTRLLSQMSLKSSETQADSDGPELSRQVARTDMQPVPVNQNLLWKWRIQLVETSPLHASQIEDSPQCTNGVSRSQNELGSPADNRKNWERQSLYRRTRVLARKGNHRLRRRIRMRPAEPRVALGEGTSDSSDDNGQNRFCNRIPFLSLAQADTHCDSGTQEEEEDDSIAAHTSDEFGPFDLRSLILGRKLSHTGALLSNCWPEKTGVVQQGFERVFSRDQFSVHSVQAEEGLEVESSMKFLELPRNVDGRGDLGILV